MSKSEPVAYANALERARDDDPALAEQYEIVMAQTQSEPLTMEELLACCQRGTHTGVLESALHLTCEDFDILAQRVKETAKEAKLAWNKGWRSRKHA